MKLLPNSPGGRPIPRATWPVAQDHCRESALPSTFVWKARPSKKYHLHQSWGRLKTSPRTGQSLLQCIHYTWKTDRRRRRAIYSSTEGAVKAFRWLWIKRADPWSNTAGAQAEVWSRLCHLSETIWCSREPKHQITPKIHHWQYTSADMKMFLCNNIVFIYLFHTLTLGWDSNFSFILYSCWFTCFPSNERKKRELKMDEHRDPWVNAVPTCLLRKDPLILRTLWTDETQWNSYWNLLLLICLVKIVFSPFVTKGMAHYFKKLIDDYHKMFKSLFPQKRLISKHTLMTHYPCCIHKIM